jgi:methyl-accepting chemotaxis protein
MLKIKYFKDWDWVICVDSTEEEFMSVQNDIRRLEKKSNYVFLSVSGITLLLVIMASMFFARRITGPIMQTVSGLRRGAEQTLLASRQVAESSLSVAEGSTEQAASVEETSSSLEEMASMTRQSADNAREADSLMKVSAGVAGEANASMDELTVSMQEISSASEETSKIIKTIDEIAFQTNLLALNAAVEAARAGDAGAGFAVVADEVRSLAMRAAEAAKTTAQLLEDTVAKVENGAQLVSRTNTAFDKMKESSARVGQLVGEIAAASGEQATGIEQVNKAVAEIDKVIQTNAANSDANVGASEEMKALAEKMRKYVATLAAVVSGGGNSSPVQRDPGHPGVMAPRRPGRPVRPEIRPGKT